MQYKKITLLVFTLLCWYLGSAQVILTAETNTPPAGYIDTIYVANGAVLDLPQAGINMTWDYSGMDTLRTFVVELLDVTGNTVFPEAYVGVPGNVKFQVFSTPSLSYQNADAEGIYSSGTVVAETSYSITAITGGADDTFTFIGDTVVYEERLNEVVFPMTYPDVFSATQIQRTNIALSVAAYGLVEAPVQNRRYFTEENMVTGYGELIIPTEDLSPSDPIEVLLVQVNRTTVDSIFLFGMLPPQALLDAFGVTQGGVTTSTSYKFYTPGLADPVLDMFVGAGGISNEPFFRPRAAQLVTGTRTLTPANFTLSPNPVQRGQSFTLQSDEDLSQGIARLLGVDGRVLHTFPLSGNGGNTYTLPVPKHLTPGLYLLQAFDQQGRMYKAEKVIVN